MFEFWSDFDRTFAALDELRRRFETPAARAGYPSTRGWPRIAMDDTGSTVRVLAEVPGLSADSIGLELKQGVLTLSGKRPVPAPEGYSVHRQERPSVSFSRSLTLPAPVDPEKVKASVKDGILEVTLEKAETAKPRRISIKTA